MSTVWSFNCHHVMVIGSVSLKSVKWSKRCSRTKGETLVEVLIYRKSTVESYTIKELERDRKH